MLSHHQYTPIPVVDLDEEPAEIVQTTKPGSIAEPVKTTRVPSRATGWHSYDLVLGAPAVQVLSEDHRRKRAVIIVSDFAGASAGARFGQSQSEAGGDRAFIMGLRSGTTNRVSDPIEYTSYTGVWATAITAACTVSIFNEQWVD